MYDEHDEIDLDGWDGDYEEDDDGIIVVDHVDDPYSTIYVFGKDTSDYKKKPR